MKKICVIGAGTMGNGITHCFAQKDFAVNLVDVSLENLEKSKEIINTNLDRMIKKEIINKLEKEAILNRISFYTDIEKAIHHIE